MRGVYLTLPLLLAFKAAAFYKCLYIQDPSGQPCDVECNCDTCVIAPQAGCACTYHCNVGPNTDGVEIAPCSC